MKYEVINKNNIQISVFQFINYQTDVLFVKLLLLMFDIFHEKALWIVLILGKIVYQKINVQKECLPFL